MDTLEINVLPKINFMGLPVDLKKTPDSVDATWLFTQCIIKLELHQRKNRVTIYKTTVL
jgi:hypothetical protein